MLGHRIDRHAVAVQGKQLGAICSSVGRQRSSGQTGAGGSLVRFCGEVTGQNRGIRHLRDLPHPIRDMPAFVVGHEEAFAPAVVHLRNVDRTARDEPKLVLAQHGLCSWPSGDVVVSSRKGVGLECIVAIEQENRPVQAVLMKSK